MIIINKRNTVQKTIILNAVRSMCCHSTAEEIYENITKQYPGISKSTVYRNLNQLADDGVILKVEVANAPDRFDSKNYNHSHMKCLGCGRVFDFETDSVISELPVDGEEAKGFKITGYELVFSGYCIECSEKTGEDE